MQSAFDNSLCIDAGKHVCGPQLFLIIAYVGVSPFEIRPYEITDAKRETKTSRADVNARKVLRKELRNGVLAAYQKLEPRLRDAIRDRADMGHIQVQVTVDLRPGE